MQPYVIAQHEVAIDYTNWRGERRIRRIMPLSISWGSTQFHPKPQWLLRARDLEDDGIKMFAMCDIHEWR